MKLSILGHGVVGSGVTTILNNLNDKEIEIKKILVKDENEVKNELMTTNYEDIFNSDIDTAVECMGGLETAHKFALRAIESKCNFITSNKKMFATFAKELFEKAKENNVNLLFEASVGGGIPWIENINRIRRIDNIHKIEGIFNGTTNYILSMMFKDNLSFEKALSNAQELGYAEADPSDDIDGYDVMYKIMISSLVSYGALINLEDIIVRGIRDINTSDIEYAKEHEYICKLIGASYLIENKIVAYVMPKFIKKDKLLANINLNDNALALTSDTLGLATFVGQGAGSLPTAHAVVQNILDIKEGNINEYDIKEYEVNNALYEGEYYIRSNRIEDYKDITKTRINDDTIITNKISLLDLYQYIKEDRSSFVGEIVND